MRPKRAAQERGRGAPPGLIETFFDHSRTSSDRKWRSRAVARGARALRHVDNQPTTHRALVSARCVLGVRLSARLTHGALHLTQRAWGLAPASRARHRRVMVYSVAPSQRTILRGQ